MHNNVRVRFAPSPTGPLHMGGVRTALYNYLFAKQNNGKFILRIEDTDQTRFVPGAEAYIMESLKWCNIMPDEAPGINDSGIPYRQSERKDIYKPYAEQLVEAGHAYYAFDTSEELEAMREAAKEAGSANWQYNHITRARMKNSLTLSESEVEEKISNNAPYVIRIKLERNEEVKVKDLIRGWVTINTNNIDDKVIFKSDGMPTYHLANVVDDHLMEISHVIRGEEWLPSLPIHVLLYRYLGWEDQRPEFAHLPLILKPDGKGKLSKRDGDRLGFPVFPIEWKNEDGEIYSGYRENGYLPEGFVNMMAFLGWNPGTEQEIFSLDELIQTFSLEKVNKAGAKFDPAKTRWFNQQHLRNLADSELAEILKADLAQNDISTTLETCTAVVPLIKERAHLLGDLYTESLYFFQTPSIYDEKVVRTKWNEESTTHLKSLLSLFTEEDNFSAEALEHIFKNYLSEHSLGFGKIGPVFRIALTGMAKGPSLFDISEILGKKETTTRIQKALDTIPING